MDTRPFEILAFVCLILLCCRVYIAIRLDRIRSAENVFLFRFVLGIYVLEALLPVLRKGESKEEHRLIKAANILVAAFYFLSASFFISIRYFF